MVLNHKIFIYRIVPSSNVSFSSCQRNLIKNISDWSYDCTDHKSGIDFFMRLVKWPKIDVKKCQNLIFKVDFQHQKSFKSFWKKNFMKNINLGATFLFLSILCSIKIKQLLFLDFLKKLAFFGSCFWLFNKTHEKIIPSFVISAIIAWIWKVFIKFRWHDEKLTTVFLGGKNEQENCQSF